MTATCRLIVNADDFGQSAGVNQGVFQAHDAGIVTSASLMVRWPAAAEAARGARSRPRLSLGLHIDLGEWRLEEGEWVPLYRVVSPDDAGAVIAEIHRQLESFRRLVGRHPTHLDSHQHVHRLEPARSAFLALACEVGGPLRHFARDIRYCGEFYGQDERGVGRSNVLCAERLISILESLPPGVTELACHPAAAADLPTMYSHERLAELAILCDERVKQRIASRGIELCSFHDVRDESVERSGVGGIS